VSTALELDRLLNQIEESSDPAIGSNASSQFMLECLALVEQSLPPLAMEAVQSVRHYLAGRLDLEAIIHIRSKCWRRIDECRQTSDGDSSEVIAIRAAIFPLHAQEHPTERDLVDHLSAFLAFVNRVEPHFEEEEALLRKHFANSLESNESQ
jgi:hypothetical protein